MTHFRGGFRINRQCQDIFGYRFCNRHVTDFTTKILEAGLQVQRERIIYHASNTKLSHLSFYFIAVSSNNSDAELIVYVTYRIIGQARENYTIGNLARGKQLTILFRVVLAGFSPTVQMWQFDSQNCCLERV